MTMLLKVIAIGKLKDRNFKERCEEYAKWLGQYAKLEIRELPDSGTEKECAAILKELEKDKGACIIALAEEGQQFTSRQFASLLDKAARKVVMIIGGPMGLSNEVKAKADTLLSLSKMTFTHEFARLILFEQLFRAANILNGGHYHRD